MPCLCICVSIKVHLIYSICFFLSFFLPGLTKSCWWVYLNHSKASWSTVLFLPMFCTRTSCVCSYETYHELSKSKVVTYCTWSTSYSIFRLLSYWECKICRFINERIESWALSRANKAEKGVAGSLENSVSVTNANGNSWSIKRRWLSYSIFLLIWAATDMTPTIIQIWQLYLLSYLLSVLVVYFN